MLVLVEPEEELELLELEEEELFPEEDELEELLELEEDMLGLFVIFSFFLLPPFR
ncbi:MAG: hypothetical protein OHK0017_06620 [Patescibacteria group bacterium]